MTDELVIADPKRWDGEYTEITRQLIELLHDNDEVRSLLKKSIVKANKVNSDPKTNPVDDISDYIRFVDRTSRLIPRDVLENPEHFFRDQLQQSICYFYFLIDQPLSELEGEDQFNSTIQYYRPFADWVREFADSWGSFLDSEASWSRKTYREFYADPRFGLQKDWYEPASFWNTFNEFFSRYLKSPDVRPIAHEDDSSVVTSPADSVPQDVFAIDEHSDIAVDDGLTVKGVTHYNVNDLLGEGSNFHGDFAGGTLTHTFLNVNDYHRYHFPVGGTVKETNKVERNAALEIEWDPKEGKYGPVDSTGWQFSQTHGSAVVETDDHGLVALIPMGMAQVSSVNFEDNVAVGNSFSKGDMLGTFLFGGSDYVILFQEEAGFELTASKGDHLLMGEKFGTLNG